jgi:hypothetical protein
LRPPRALATRLISAAQPPQANPSVPEAEVLEVEEVPFTRFRVRQPDSSSKPTMGSKPSSPGTCDGGGPQPDNVDPRPRTGNSVLTSKLKRRPASTSSSVSSRLTCREARLSRPAADPGRHPPKDRVAGVGVLQARQRSNTKRRPTAAGLLGLAAQAASHAGQWLPTGSK